MNMHISPHTCKETGPPPCLTPEEIAICANALDYPDLFEDFFNGGPLDGETYSLLTLQLIALAKKANFDGNARQTIAILAKFGVQEARRLLDDSTQDL